MKKPHYARWYGMMHRCYEKCDPYYYRYGGRGIRVCAAWKTYEGFLAWAEQTFQAGKTLERKDNNKGYSPKNCTWATLSEQASNREPQPEKIAQMQSAAFTARNAIYGDPQTRKQKFCPTCKEWLTLDSFYSQIKRGKLSQHGWCKPCSRQRAKKLVEGLQENSNGP